MVKSTTLISCRIVTLQTNKKYADRQESYSSAYIIATLLIVMQSLEFILKKFKF
jgi:hypothetical protein